MNQTDWKENLILIDADYVDGVVFNLIVNLERMINRPLPKADLAEWLVCAALDGGMTNSNQEIQVVVLRSKAKIAWDNFLPERFDAIDGQAFRDEKLGEFLMSVLPDEVPAEEDALMVQAFSTLLTEKGVKNITVVPAPEHVHALLHTAASCKDKEITLLTMEPLHGGKVHNEILGYSLMHALGIRSEEITPES